MGLTINRSIGPWPTMSMPLPVEVGAATTPGAETGLVVAAKVPIAVKTAAPAITTAATRFLWSGLREDPDTVGDS